MMRKYLRITAITAALGAAVALSMTCSNALGTFDNPGDSKSSTYQGYDAVTNPDSIAAAIPADKGTLSGTRLTATQVIGATAYELRIADTAAALDSAPLYSKVDYATNVMDISASGIQDRTSYWWKVRATASDGNWGAWSAPTSFTTSWPTAAVTPTFSPTGTTYSSDQSVTITSTTAGATIYYTTDGSTPTSASTKYTAPISATINPGTTIKAIVVAPFLSQSAVGTATYRNYAVGDTGPAGGIVFYDKGSVSNGWRYLEAAPSDQSTSIQWYNGSDLSISTGTAIGTGKANTDAIIAAQGSGSYAASLCKNLTLGGYSDWFLPSKDELNLMYTNLKLAGLGGFGEGWLWSSSQYDASYYTFAWGRSFSDGRQDIVYKYTSRSVRACRAF